MSDPSASSPSTGGGAAASQDRRGSRRVIIGTVTSSTMEKTATVTVIRRVRDRRFHKFLTRRVKYHVHDEHNTAKVGDLVEIVESRPMSKTKRWRLLNTISSAADVETHGRAHGDQPQVEK